MKLFSKIKDDPPLSFLIGLLILALGAFVGVLFCECIETYITKRLGSSNKNETLQFLGISMGGILVALQAMMSYRRAKAMEDAVEKTEQGQRQDRLKNAIEHLGHESDSVRLGGAYELFHLVEDAENKDLRPMVFNILCAHIRRTTGERKYRKTYESKPSAEVQSLLTLLFIQKHEVFKGLHINLEGSWLNGADLKEARLRKAVLTQAYLQGAILHKAHLQGTVLHQAQLQGIILTCAKLHRAYLKSAKLQGANLSIAQLQGAKLDKVYLQGADLSVTQLQGATLTGAKLQGATLIQTHLQGAILFEAKLQGATLTGAKLQGIVRDEWLASVSFEDCIKNQIGKETDFSLSKVIFSDGLTQEDVDSLAKGLSNEKANELRKKLESHIDQPESYELPEDSGAITDPYTEEDAEQWIAEYKQARSEVPADDS